MNNHKRMANRKKDCFNDCIITACLNYGHSVVPLEYCLADPLISRYVRRVARKEPCDTCAHGDMKEPCSRCVHK